MSTPTRRRRKTLDEFTPEQRSAIEAVERANRTPERRSADARVRELVMREIPPKRQTPDPALVAALADLRDERHRQGLTLEDVSRRTGIDPAVLSRLETGKSPNPTVATLRAYAGALGKRLEWTVRDLHPAGT